MQATLVICAAQPGMLYLNGYFAGEVAPDEPLIRPVAQRGAVYLDYRPLKGGWLPAARKIVFSGGVPLKESVEEAEDIGAVVWPGNICEIEITPPPCGAADARKFSIGGHGFSIRGEVPKLYCGDRLLGTLPEGALVPRLYETPAGCVFLGEAPGGMYLLSADAQLERGTGFLSADKIEFSADGSIRALLSENDFAGHGAAEKWQLTPEGLQLISSEPVWSGGSPRMPERAQDTVIAAVQAALLGRAEEAEQYLSDALRSENPLNGLYGKYEMCTEMKYAHPDNRPCVALIRLIGEHMAYAEPLYYICVRRDGRYWIESIETQQKTGSG